MSCVYFMVPILVMRSVSFDSELYVSGRTDGIEWTLKVRELALRVNDHSLSYNNSPSTDSWKDKGRSLINAPL